MGRPQQVRIPMGRMRRLRGVLAGGGSADLCWLYRPRDRYYALAHKINNTNGRLWWRSCVGVRTCTIIFIRSVIFRTNRRNW